MKKVKIFIITLLCLIFFPITANATSGSIRITGTSSAVVGNTVTITVTLSSSTPIGSWDMDLNYDRSYLQLISANSEAGGVSMVNSSSGTTSKSYTFKFKALKSGSTKLSMSSYSAYAYEDMSAMKDVYKRQRQRGGCARTGSAGRPRQRGALARNSR